MTGRTIRPRERLEAVFSGSEPDRTPICGGWIACPDHIAAIAGVSLPEYWTAPLEVSIRAYQILGTDGLIDCFVPRSDKDFRCVDAESYVHARTAQSLEEALARIDAMPSADELEAQFNMEESYAAFRNSMLQRQALCGDMVWMPAQWSAGARITWYGEFGYETFFTIMGAYPDRARKLVEVGGAQGHCVGRLVARAVQEGIYPHAVLLGEDICTQRGPMISPQFMARHYAPALAHGLQPLLDVDCKPVWHSDGDIRPLIPMLLDCGIQGFQGFQPECGMTLEYVVQHRTRDGAPLLIFGPLSVTTELPVLPAEEIKARARRAIALCRGRASLVLFTANTINPDVPLENILALYDAVQAT